jgi:ferrochelatase
VERRVKLAVVLFNLGGPDSPQAIEPFLFNLFNDVAIIGLPAPLRRVLARWMSRRRLGEARSIFDKIGGSSPLLEGTRAQAVALEARLGAEARVFIAMRYWHPMIEEAVAEVLAFDPGQIVLLPLYPQFSSTTTGSSLAAWGQAADGIGAATSAVCCYPEHPGLIRAHAELLEGAIGEARDKAGGIEPRVFFSAHGLPERTIRRGDPYRWQVERTAAAIAGALNLADWCVCYQSRVGPLKWIGPEIGEELAHAGRDGVPVVVVPIAFVSEHSETLVELDMIYRARAGELGIPAYVRVPVVGTSGDFIGALADLVEAAVGGGPVPACGGPGGPCPAAHRLCPHDPGACQ